MLTETLRIIKSRPHPQSNSRKELIVQHLLVILVEELVISKETVTPEEDQLKPLERGIPLDIVQLLHLIQWSYSQIDVIVSKRNGLMQNFSE